MRKAVAEKLADQVSDWAQRGLIEEELHELLKRRYAVEVSMGRVLLRWLGMLAVFMLGMSVLGFIGMGLGKIAAFVAPFLVAAVAALAWRKGVEMVTDPSQRFPTSGAVLVTSGLLGLFASLVSLYGVFGGDAWRYVIPVLMIMTAAASGYTAYRYRLRWPLWLGLLLVFHGLGNMHRYGGSGSYYMGIDDERLTLIAGLVAIGIGLWHERRLERDLDDHYVGFGQAYVVLGLLYINLSAWFLSIPRGSFAGVLFFTGLCIAQIVAGGRLFDHRFIGFGIVFLSINLYTRLFEHFWDDLSKGSFFLVGGLIALAAGLVFERRARRLTSEVQP